MLLALLLGAASCRPRPAPPPVAAVQGWKPALFAAVGFAVPTREAFVHLAERANREGKPIACRRGSYALWTCGAGVQLWMQRDAAGSMIAMHPHYDGPSRLRAGVTRRVNRKGDGPLEGAFLAWAWPSPRDPNRGEHAMLFDSPAADLEEPARFPAVRGVQIAAFAREMNGYANDRAYERARNVKFGAEQFAPAGLFAVDGGIVPSPEASAIFAGHVVDGGHVTNPVSGEEFLWARVRTMGRVLDLVASPDCVKGKIRKRGVIEGTFWLSGRICDAQGRLSNSSPRAVRKGLTAWP